MLVRLEMDARLVNIDGFAAIRHLPGALLLVVPGLVLGFGYFRSLRFNADLFVRRAPLWQSLGLQLLRLALVTAAMAAISLLGTAPLLAAFAGLMVGRHIVLRSVRAS